jgi:GH43 family beta-xylosidase
MTRTLEEAREKAEELADQFPTYYTKETRWEDGDYELQVIHTRDYETDEGNPIQDVVRITPWKIERRVEEVTATRSAKFLDVDTVME